MSLPFPGHARRLRNEGIIHLRKICTRFQHPFYALESLVQTWTVSPQIWSLKFIQIGCHSINDILGSRELQCVSREEETNDSGKGTESEASEESKESGLRVQVRSTGVAIRFMECESDAETKRTARKEGRR
jgi:hypothetical protein